MQTFFTSEFFTNNRKALREAINDGMPIVITGNGVMQRGADEPSSFHQDSNFWYLTGIDSPDLILVMTAQETYLIVPSMSATREAFDGAHNVDIYRERSGIEHFYDEAEGWHRLKGLGEAATLSASPEHMKHYGIYTLPFRRRLIARLKRVSPGIAIKDIRLELAGLRVVKQPQEIQAIQAAIDITSQTLQTIASDVLPNVQNEYEIDAALGYGFRMRGAAGHAFAPIVGAGKHTTTLHYLANDGPITRHDMIVLDVGAEVEHYAADLSRVISQSPMSGRQSTVFKAVEAIQDYAMGLMRPGAFMRDIEIAVETAIGEQLKQLGVIDELSRENIRPFYPHAVSHFLGLDTHDAGDYQKPLRAGMVITCEPGIYLPDEAIGVRIEDDILITETGHTVLSATCPRRLTPVE